MKWTLNLFILTGELILYMVASEKVQEKRNLYLGGFFAVNLTKENWNGAGIIPSVQMAIEDINNRNDILNDYNLILLWNDTQGSPGLANKILFDMVSSKPTKIALLGPGYSVTARSVALVSYFYGLNVSYNKKFLNETIEVSYSAQANLLADRSTFKYFYRTCASDYDYNMPRISTCKYFNWTKVAIIYENDQLFVTGINQFKAILEEHKIEVITVENFEQGGDMTDQMRSLKNKGARIIFGFFYEDNARRAMCTAYHFGLTDKLHQWFLPSWYPSSWWAKGDNNINCTIAQMHQAVQYYLAVNDNSINSDKEGISGMTPFEFDQRYRNHSSIINNVYHRNNFAASGYDAVWAIALALNRSQEQFKSMNRTLDQFHYNNAEMGRIIANQLDQVKFEGISNYIKFDTKGNLKIDKVDIFQQQDGKIVRIGLAYPSNRSSNFKIGRKVLWKGNKIPYDGPIRRTITLTITPSLFITMAIISSMGIALSLIMLGLNIKYRNHK
ncbi:uncharacterized protein TRIADDRAFT_51953 [Trichoplax adhaerens]|uniref:Gamma-aminobutyric acid type B receptor subunit 2 n=1 Tax=Trichoplax adhaerens TaxID=10228 RepID=B3RLC0_TRIAD|nr:hypothetical protein TRIADDRAFT_51953 [Trichoplax adhaerens]EDV28740.1 hypothetical protein TRIADDRAFT_51953 [Trichoplax adhaerens]|eukprot:XP_002107942.1 hypothetical protein TRIADDRAFT_51953 [Trichoplax adhaerens]